MNARNNPVSKTHDSGITIPELDQPTTLLVKLAALLAGGSETQIREALTDALATVPAEWVEELILQTYLFAGFPRSLNASREWRRISGRPAPNTDKGASYDIEDIKAQGEITCVIVYGDTYTRLRQNIRNLHPALDAWMIIEGYGKVLSRPELDLARRELCIIAACAIAKQDRQLHAHLHGALNAGASILAVNQALDALSAVLDKEDHSRYIALWQRVRNSHKTHSIQN